MGCKAETLRGRVRQHERETGMRDGVTSAEKERIKALEREVRELRTPTRSCAQAGLAPSVGGVGDSYDDAFAETINGQYKAEVIIAGPPGAPATRSSGQRSTGSIGPTTGD